MSRLISVVGLFVGLAATSALAADYPDMMRGSYPASWDMSDEGDPLGFEFGVRYFYSAGFNEMTIAGAYHNIQDTKHAVEVHGRIDDFSTGTFLKGYAGYSGVGGGSHNTPLTGGTVAIDSGTLAYALVDFGYLGFGTEAFTFGPFVGYQFVNAGSSTAAPAESVNAEYHMVRLGVAARAELGDQLDLSAELAINPYADLSGGLSTGAVIQSTLVGVSGEAMVGYHATDNITVRAGGRAWYLTDSFGAGGGSSYSSLRVGGLFEVTYDF